MSTQEEQYLSADVRKKYIAELKKHKDSWIETGATILFFIAVYIAMLIAGEDLKGIVWLWVFAGPVVIVGGISGVVESAVGTESKLSRHSDKMLELLYNEMKNKQAFKKLTSKVITTIVIVGAGIILFMSLTSEKDNIVKTIWNNFFTDAKCKIISGKAIDDSFYLSGQPDFGYTVIATVMNKGEKGDVYLNIKLKSSEGELLRKQTISMNAKETRVLKYQFPEPTVNATNVSYVISCSPK